MRGQSSQKTSHNLPHSAQNTMHSAQNTMQMAQSSKSTATHHTLHKTLLSVHTAQKQLTAHYTIHTRRSLDTQYKKLAMAYTIEMLHSEQVFMISSEFNALSHEVRRSPIKCSQDSRYVMILEVRQISSHQEGELVAPSLRQLARQTNKCYKQITNK